MFITVTNAHTTKKYMKSQKPKTHSNQIEDADYRTLNQYDCRPLSALHDDFTIKQSINK